MTKSLSFINMPTASLSPSSLPLPHPGLSGSAATLAAASAMPLSLLDSQLATLEPPDSDENFLGFGVAERPEDIVAAVLAVRHASAGGVS